LLNDAQFFQEENLSAEGPWLADYPRPCRNRIDLVAI